MQVTFNVGLKISRWQAAEAFLHRTKAGDELFGMGAWEEAPLGLDLVLRDMWVMLVVGLGQMILEGFSNLRESVTLQRGWQAPKMKNAGCACKGWLGRMYIIEGLSWRPFRKAGKVKVMLGVFLFFPITDPSCSRASRQGLAKPTCTLSCEPAVWHQLLLFLLGWTWLRPLFCPGT